MEWSRGDFFVFFLSFEEMFCMYFCVDDEDGGIGGVGLYWVLDVLLFLYFGVVFKVLKFKLVYFRWG